MIDIAIIGAGIAGLEAARQLALRGHKVEIFEKESYAGGHAAQWHELFPFGRNGSLILKELAIEAQKSGAKIRLNAAIDQIGAEENNWQLRLENSEIVEARSVLLATGFELFDARLKEELGYGIYPAVITAQELEQHWSKGLEPFGTNPVQNFAIVHCVGSRDLKCNQAHCSKVCCMVGINTAIALKRKYPRSTVTNFYMDLRMFDHGYEELYHKAQLEYGVQFVRGRVSEIGPASNKQVVVKAEDTLLGLPVNCIADGVILLTGMTPPHRLSQLPLEQNSMGFWSSGRRTAEASETTAQGLFIAGSCKGPMTLTESVADARSAVLSIENYLKIMP